ncbi:hypothetical protein OSB04_011752 [Centaurea solstitialis]|uniref:Uncharacterized protein n=1 Tax=Centaurea solstitialis TaxID=347529 RepID=A0AA38TUS8_9ASTR|nr:hypothetical protein OSB04_011752 [Centaurea solstitialis]
MPELAVERLESGRPGAGRWKIRPSETKPGHKMCTKEFEPEKESQNFTRVSDDGRKHSKLDRLFASIKFCSTWRNMGVKVLERKWSNHYLIMPNDINLNFRSKTFKIFDTWLKGANIESMVREAWSKKVASKYLDCAFGDKLKNKVALKTWCNDKYRSLEGIGTERGIWLEAWKYGLRRKKKSKMARQKVKKLAEEGDENSKLFHAVIRKRVRSNGICGLNVNAVWTKDL